MIQTVSLSPLLPLSSARMRVFGIVLVDDVDDLALGGAIDLADVVVAALGGDLEALEPYQAADDDLAGAARGAHGDIEQWMHGGTIANG